MEAKIGKFFESVGSFFSGGYEIPWCDSDIITNCEHEVAEAGKVSSDELKSECFMRLSWALVHSKRPDDECFMRLSRALVHSKRPDDVKRGLAMLGENVVTLSASVGGSNSPLQMREKFYLLAVGYYRIGDYARSRKLVDHCLKIAPGWRQALALRKTIKEKITKVRADGGIGIGIAPIAVIAVGLLAGGVVAALACKK